MAEENKIKEAVVLFAISSSGKILMVSRKNGKFGLPGGKVEEGETLKEACVRELREETGLIEEQCNLQLLYSAWCQGYLCHTFGLFKDGKFIVINEEALIATNLINSPEGLEVSFKSIEEVHENSEFVDYNMGVIESYLDWSNYYKGETHVTK